MLELEEAVTRVLAEVPPPKSETIPLSEAFGRVVTKQVASKLNLPPFDNSAMDGYAVRAVDVSQAKSESAVSLKLIGRATAGEVFSGEVGPGTCVRVFTGSAMPAGADAVVMQEDTKTNPAESAKVLLLEPVRPWENVRLCGEDVKTGAILAELGTRLTVGRLSLLAACGMKTVEVGEQPAVGLVATGSELREADQELKPGQIYESNRLGLAALVRSAGGIPRIFPLIGDSFNRTREALENAFTECDAVITSGGVSVGEMDFVKAAFEASGGQLQFWKVAIKPGRPFVFGTHGDKLLFGLPGNPVSALVTFLLLVRPALLRWQGSTVTELANIPGVLGEPLANAGGRRHFMRVRIDENGRVYSAGAQASHVLSSLAVADGLVDVAAETTLPAGAQVKVRRWE